MANYTNSASTKQIKVGAGKLYGIFVSSTTAGTLTIYDSASSNTGDALIVNTFTLVAGTQYLSNTAGIFFNKGLYVVVGGIADFTVVYE